MKTLLTHLRALRTPQTQDNSFIPIELLNCTTNNTISSDYSGNLTANDFICVNAKKHYFIALGDSLTILGVGNSTGMEVNLGPVNKAWGATTGLYMLKATKDTSLNIYFSRFSGMSESETKNTYNKKLQKNYSKSTEKEVILSIGKSRTITIAEEIVVKNNAQVLTQKKETEKLIVFNPFNATIKYTYDKTQIYPDTEPEYRLIGGINQTQDTWIESQVEPINPPLGDDVFDHPERYNLDDLVGKYKYTLKCEITSTSVPDYFPSVNVKLTPDTILSKESESYSFMTGGSLSPGETAAIVIVVIAVVAAVAVLIVCWFFKWLCFKKEKVSDSYKELK